ncbi:MAG: adenylosuccinate lyase [Dehalococcoidia bacterium]|nr:adenylosuccinate lyase [Dehalococcoidia bacterium]
MIDRYSRPAMKKVWSEERKYDLWLKVELAVCEAWAIEGAVPKDAVKKLRKARYTMEGIERAFAETRHDMNSFLRSVAESVGTESRFMHLGLTSYDVQDNAMSLQLMEASDLLLEGVSALGAVVREQAVRHKRTLMMGRTHGVHAEPTTWGMKLLVWVEELKRHEVRLRQAREMVAVGKVSGAVGSHATVPPSVEDGACKRLGLAVVVASTQTLQRDRHAQFVQALALLAASLEKFATEIRGLQKTEVREVEEPFGEGQTGSSAMPHKRNPELCERVCGLARLVRGFSVTALENVALWHERDISHSSAERIILPDSCLALDYMMDIFTLVMRDLKVFPERMRKNLDLTRGLVFSQRVLTALIETGMTRQEAYKLVQRNAMRAWDSGAAFRELLEKDAEVKAALKKKDLDALFDYGYYARYVDEVFSRAGL